MYIPTSIIRYGLLLDGTVCVCVCVCVIVPLACPEAAVKESSKTVGMALRKRDADER